MRAEVKITTAPEPQRPRVAPLEADMQQILAVLGELGVSRLTNAVREGMDELSLILEEGGFILNNAEVLDWGEVQKDPKMMRIINSSGTYMTRVLPELKTKLGYKIDNGNIVPVVRTKRNWKDIDKHARGIQKGFIAVMTRIYDEGRVPERARQIFPPEIPVGAVIVSYSKSHGLGKRE